MDDQLTAPIAPRHSHPRLAVVLIASVIAALAIGAYLLVVMQMPLPGALGRMLSARTLPVELHDARFISSSPNGSVVYERADYSYVPVAEFQGPVRAVVRTENGYAALESGTSGEPPRLVVEGEFVHQAPSLRSLAASPDGRRVAYVETTDGSAYAIDPSLWTTKIFYPDPWTTQTVGGGSAPFFLSDTVLGRVTALGIFQVDLETGVPSALLRESIAHPPETVAVSPDHTLIAWRDPSDRISVYRITDGAATLLGVHEFEEAAQSSTFALGNDAFYAVRITNNGSEIWRRGFDEASTRLAVLPMSISITALTFAID